MVNHVTGHNESIALTRGDDVWEQLHAGAKQAVPTAFQARLRTTICTYPYTIHNGGLCLDIPW